MGLSKSLNIIVGYFKRFVKAWDLTTHNSGTDVLRLMVVLWMICTVLGFVFLVTANLTRMLLHPEAYSDWHHWRLYTVWLHFLLSMFGSVLNISLLWKSINTGSPKYLKYLLVYNLAVFPLNFSFELYFGYFDTLEERRPFYGRIIVNYFSTPVIKLMYFYAIALIYRCYVKSSSPLITQFYAHCLDLRANEYTCSKDHCKEDKSIDVTKCHFESQLANDTRKSSVQSDTSESSVTVITSDQFEKHIVNPLNISIDFSQVLGEGQFGIVYKGRVSLGRSKEPIAIKVIKNPTDSEMFSLLLQEVKMLIRVGAHENVIGFFGITSDSFNHFNIIMEYCGGGCLETFLRDNRHTFINMIRSSGINCHPELPLIYSNLHDHGTHSTSDLIKFAIGVAHGMEHLASKKIVHGDLATRNVLLTQNNCVKLIDFGLSQRLYNYQMYSKIGTQQFLPWRWMSPEAIQDLKLSEKSDSFSFGVLLWEIFTLGDCPHEKIADWSSEIPNMIKSGQLRLERPKYAIAEIYRLMESCWKSNCDDRPNFEEISKALAVIQTSSDVTH